MVIIDMGEDIGGNGDMKIRTKIRLWWNKLWIRKDEFHSSLNVDLAGVLDMNEKERDKYATDLIRRRNIAHEREN